MSEEIKKGIFEYRKCNDAEMIFHYKTEGWILLRNFFDITGEMQPLYQDINRLIDIKLQQLGLKSLEENNLTSIRNKDFRQIIEKDRAAGGDIYRACRHLCPMHKLLVSDKVIQLGKLLMDTNFINALPYTAIRIDIPDETKYLFPWHQDYPYTQGSVDGIVFWIPLLDVMVGEGNVKIIPKSHKELKKIKLIDLEKKGGSGAHVIEIEQLESYDNYDSISTDVKAGDILIFNTLIIHKSTRSNSNQTRWTIQLRLANFFNPDAIKRGWPAGLFEGDSFESRHPEYIVN